MTKINQLGKTPKRLKIGPGRRLHNWLNTYIEFTDDNEAPTLFHMWCGLGAVSAAVGRQVWMDMKFFEVYSNLFMVLVAPPGTARKTTALKMARRLVSKVPGIHLCPQEVSPQAILKRMSEMHTDGEEHQSMAAYSLEFGTLLGKGPRQDAMIDFLTDVFDCNPDFDKETIGRGKELAPKPWFSLNGATQPSWIKDHMSPSALETGFVSRILWIYADERKLSNPLPETDERFLTMQKDLINDLSHISTLQGKAALDAGAREFYIAWYMDDSRFPKSIDTRMGNYYERKHIHLLKVAMLLSLTMDDSLIITTVHLEVALSLLGDMEPGMHKSFTGVGKNTYSTDVERLYAQITERGGKGVHYAEIVAANFHALTKDELDRVLGHLMAMQRIQLYPGNYYGLRTAPKRPATI